MTLAREDVGYQGGVAELQPQSERLRRGHRGQDRSRKQQPTTVRIPLRDTVGPKATDGSGRQDAEGWDRPRQIGGAGRPMPSARDSPTDREVDS